jgi:ribonuclease J
MTSLTFYGGINEIGGNKILLEDKGTKVFIDFGLQMGKAGQYFAEFLNPRNLSGMGDLFEFNLLPRLEGIYRKDYAKHMGTGDEKIPTAVDGVLLSHAHVDHCAYIHYLRPEIPIYCSESSKMIMQCFEDTGGDEQYITYKENFKIYQNSKGSVSRARNDEQREVIPREIRVIKPFTKLKLDSITVESIPIDHSLPGVFGFLIHTSEGDIGYTADIRFHGRRKESSQKFVDMCGAENLDYLLCEGTRINKTETYTEFQVEDKVIDAINKTKNLVVCNYPTRDLDRLLSFYNAVKQTGRTLVIDTKQAYLLKLFQDSEEWKNIYPSPRDSNIKVFVSRKSWGLLDKNPDYWTREIIEQDYKNWEREFLDYPNFVDYRDVSKNQKKYVFYCSDYSLQNLIDVRPDENSGYIRSSTEPFDLEMTMDQARVKRWLIHFGLLTDDGGWNSIHVSGHGTQDQIEHVIKGANSKKLIPIHTQHEHLFEKYHNNVTNVKVNQEFKLLSK